MISAPIIILRLSCTLGHSSSPSAHSYHNIQLKDNELRTILDMPETALEFHKDRSVHKGPIHYPFWFGGSASCFAACVTHPLDLSKKTNHMFMRFTLC